MSRTIDERVVSMQFDNKQFESNVRTSMSTLDKLKQSLNLSGASKGLENVGAAAKNVNMSGLSNAVDTVKDRFSALEIMGVTALANITNSAVNAGKSLIASLSIDQITAGWSKYGDKTASVQTIMNATGKSIDEVNGYLDKLMWFSDETSYGFTDMTSALGQLTSAGGDIDKLIPMITGIANATAYAGKGATEFSRAIYNLNQSYSSGHLQYMDWRSLELAGVASKELKQVFIDTAVALGKIGEGDVTIANFGETLKDAWADTEVMEAAFGKFGEMTEKAYQMVQAGEVETASEAYAILAEKYDGVAITAAKAAQEAKTFGEAIDATKDAVSSGWMKTFEIIFGNYEEAKVLWTDLANAMWDAFASGAEARNEMLQEWKDLGGRDALVKSFWNVWEGVASVIKPIKEAFREIFPKTTAEQLFKITERIRDFTEKLILSEKAQARLKSTFKGLFIVIEAVVTVFKTIIGVVFKLLGGLKFLGSALLKITGAIGDCISGIRDWVSESSVLKRAIELIGGVIQKVTAKIKEFVGALKEKISMPGLGQVSDVLGKIWSVIKKVASKIGEVISTIAKGIADAFRNGGIKSALDILNSGLITTILLKFKKGLGGFDGSLKGVVKAAKDVTSISGSITGILNSVKDCFTAWQKEISAKALMTIAKAIAILAVSILIIASINPERLSGSLTAITMLFMNLAVAMAVFNKIGEGPKGAIKASASMIAFSTAILILSGALKTVSSLNLDEIGRGLVGVAGLMAIAIGALAALTKFAASSNKVFEASKKGLFSSKTKTNFISMGIALIAIAASMKIFASAAKDIADLEWEELGKAGAGIAGILGIVVAFEALMNVIKPKKLISGGAALLIIAASLKVFASAANDFGAIEWESLGKAGTAMAGVLVLAAGFMLLSGLSKKMLSSSTALLIISVALKILAGVCKVFGAMEWESLGKAGAAIAGLLVLAAGFTLLAGLSKKLTRSVIGLTVMALALSILARVCKKFGAMEWESLGKAGAAIAGLLVLATAFALLGNLAPGILKASAALAIMSVAIGLFTPSLIILGNLNTGTIAKGLLTIAAAFVVLGVAGYALGPAVPAILSVAGALALMGLAAVAFGVGITAISVGLIALAGAFTAGGAAIVAAIGVIIHALIELIPAIAELVEKAIVYLCKAIKNSVVAIGEALIAVIQILLEVIIKCIPQITDTLLKLTVGVLESFVKYVPNIVDSFMKLIVAVIDGIAKGIPDIIKSIVNLIGSIFKGVVDALDGLDFEVVAKTAVGIGLLAAMVAALGAIVPLIPGAMVGVVGIGVVVTELSGVIAALGVLRHLPGLEWLISEGGNFLQTLGTAIGQFVGGIAGGVALGATSTLPQLGENLAGFMTNAAPFFEAVKTVDASTLTGVRSLVDMILDLTGANILEGVTSWITGGSSLTKFGEEIAAFAPNLKIYAETVKDIDPSVIDASVNAAKCLSELANNLPNSGGVAGFFAGNNDIGTFGEQLVAFGNGMKSYSETVSGIDIAAITASAGAAKALAKMSNIIPNQGGLIAWFAGDNSVAKFAFDLGKLGKGLKEYSGYIAGIDVAAVEASAYAAKVLAEMSQCVPNEGGLAAWITGDNSIANFAYDLGKLGKGLRDYSLATAGIDAAAVTASAGAAKALAEMTQCIPNEGGIVAWFAGENSIANFAHQLPTLGLGLLGFSNSVAGINIENVLAATSAAKALAEMASVIPNEGGMVAWFTGENSVASFGSQLPILGQGLLGFSNAVAGINTENVIAASNSAKSLAEMTQYVPNEGGVKAWFVGESGLSKFSNEMLLLGQGLLGFSNAVTGIDPETVVAAGNAAKSLAEMTQYIPNEGGIKAWFSGESGLVKFSSNLPLLGQGLLGFSNSIVGINAENITAAANAAKSLAEMTQYIPNEGGIKAWFSGKSGVATFSANLPTLGAAMKGFSESLEGVNPENIAAAATAAKDLAQMTTTVPEDTSRLLSFGNNLGKFAKKLGTYFAEVSKINAETMSASTKSMQAVSTFASSINPDGVKSAADALVDMVKAVKQCASVKGAATSGFVSAVRDLGKVQINNLLQTFKDGNSKLEQAGKELMTSFIEGLKGKSGAIKDAGKKLVSDCADAISDNSSAFKTAGENVVDGFADGISENTFKAEAKAKAMAEAALEAAKEALDENSPSKEFYRIGDYAGIGFVNAFADNMSVSYKAGSGIAETAIDGLRSAISQVGDAVNSDIDTQPTIRPVLDLSDVKAGAGSISSLFGMRPSVGVMSNLGRISSMMNDNQNGTNDDIISAIRELGDKIDDVSGDTYTINGVTYDDGSNISEAVKSIVRAARVERRM